MRKVLQFVGGIVVVLLVLVSLSSIASNMDKNAAGQAGYDLGVKVGSAISGATLAPKPTPTTTRPARTARPARRTGGGCDAQRLIAARVIKRSPASLQFQLANMLKTT